MIIRKRAYPRAALVGNPSDGYFGKTIAFTFSNFSAEVVLYETPELEILPNTRDHSLFNSIEQLADDVRSFGYYGGIRLLKATVKRFFDYTREHGFSLRDDNFTLRYASDIPHLVGLAGSSAIITACLRALMAFYEVSIAKPEMANLVLSVEQDELGISAGLQDRVAQAYQGLVYMDFAEDLMKARGYGEYRVLDPASLPPLYIAFRRDLSQGSEVFHNDFKSRFAQGDPEILAGIRKWAELTDRVRDSLLEGRSNAIGPLLNANFDLRQSLAMISEGNQNMVDTARSLGASAKFTGSGGAIIGTYADEAMFCSMEKALGPSHVCVIKPDMVPTIGGSQHDS